LDSDDILRVLRSSAAERATAGAWWGCRLRCTSLRNVS